MEVQARIRYENTINDVLALNQRHTEPHLRRAIRGWSIAIPVLALVFTVLWWRGDNKNSLWALLIMPTLMSIIFLMLYPSAARSKAEAALRRLLSQGRNAGVYCEHILELVGDTLVERTPVSETRSSLVGLERVVTTPDYSFIYVQALSAHIIPRDALIEGDHDAFMRVLADALQRLGGDAEPPEESPAER